MFDDYGIRRGSLFGLNIIESKTRIYPKIQLGEAAPVSDKCRAEFNQWLREMFGTYEYNPIPAGVAYMFDSTCIMRPESIVKLINCI